MVGTVALYSHSKTFQIFYARYMSVHVTGYDHPFIVVIGLGKEKVFFPFFRFANGRQDIHLSRQRHVISLRPGQTLYNFKLQPGLFAY